MYNAMDFTYTKDKITIEKELNALDNFVIEFTQILNKVGIKYVVISGYIAILFGRSRTSEDIDMFVEHMPFATFERLWEELSAKFECIITGDVHEAYHYYLSANHALRFAYKDEFIPNMEIKFPKVELDNWSLKNKRLVFLNGHELFTSPLELQIVYKLFMASDKDIEDARHLYLVFKDNLDRAQLEAFKAKFKIGKEFDKYLK